MVLQWLPVACGYLFGYGHIALVAGVGGAGTGLHVDSLTHSARAG